MISVIVPVYNSEQYICDCIESVRMQTYTHFELLLIDDGSSDLSGEICEKICEKDKRIRLIRQNHKGVSAARNAGITAAEGQYLLFLDSDDAIHPKLLESLYNLQKEKCSVICTEGRYYAKGGNFRKPQEWDTDIQTGADGKSLHLDNEKAIEYLLDGRQESTLYVIGGKMIRRDRLNGLRFDEKLSQGEDTLFLYRLLEEGADVSVLLFNWYYYRRHRGGISNIFSVRSCREKCSVERYICSHEMKAGRVFNAIQKEEYIISQLMEWYKESRSRQDIRLIKCVKRLAEEEKRLYAYSQICWINKWRFYIIFHCYQVYCIAHKVLSYFPRYPQLLWDIKYKNMLKKRAAML